MLDEEAIQAVRDGRYDVRAIRAIRAIRALRALRVLRAIDRGASSSTAGRASHCRSDGSHPPDSVHGLVAA